MNHQQTLKTSHFWKDESWKRTEKLFQIVLPSDAEEEFEIIFWGHMYLYVEVFDLER